ncbi:MAG: EAL domain-containing protein [Pseudomonadota bacterium]
MTSPISNSGVTPITLDPDDLNLIFPFGILVGPDGVILGFGASMEKLPGMTTALGKQVFDALHFTKPRLIDREKLLQDVLGKRITCEVSDPNGLKPVAFFGMAFNVTMAGTHHVLLMLTPGVNARTLVEDRGLSTTDFGAADGSADLLLLLAMQEEMVADGKKKSARLEAARDEAERLANHDALTGLPNRRALMRELARCLSEGPLSVMHVDLDHFKEINDTFGHAAGDAALRHAAEGLRTVVGEGALCARIGGDEFVAILEGEVPQDQLEVMANVVVTALSRPFDFRGAEITAGASVGMAQTTVGDGQSPDDVLHSADLALYEAKRGGRGHALLCTPQLINEHAAFQGLSADIRHGLTENEFAAFFQPQVNAQTGTLSGFEALARWHHPMRGIQLPATFMPAAERAGLMQVLDAQVRRSALDTLAIWDREGFDVPKVSLNVTMKDLQDPEFRDVLEWDVLSRDLTPQRVVLEIVESVLYDESATGIHNACDSLVQRGFTLALDDFGTGHASILSLVELPMSLVKIDRAFIAGIASNERKRTLARSMIDIALTLGLEVLAEGADDARDVETLQTMGCNLFQSFHFARPMSHADTLDWLRTRPRQRKAG